MEIKLKQNNLTGRIIENKYQKLIVKCYQIFKHRENGDLMYCKVMKEEGDIIHQRFPPEVEEECEWMPLRIEYRYYRSHNWGGQSSGKAHSH